MRSTKIFTFLISFVLLFNTACIGGVQNEIDYVLKETDNGNEGISNSAEEKTESSEDISQSAENLNESGELTLTKEDFEVLNMFAGAFDCISRYKNTTLDSYDDISAFFNNDGRILSMVEVMFFNPVEYDDEFAYGPWIDMDYCDSFFENLMGITSIDYEYLTEKSDSDDGIEVDGNKFRVYETIKLCYSGGKYSGSYDLDNNTYTVISFKNDSIMYRAENEPWSFVDWFDPSSVISLRLEKDNSEDNPFGYRIEGLSWNRTETYPDYSYTLSGYDFMRTASININDIDWNEYLNTFTDEDVQSLSYYDKVLTGEEQIVYFENDDTKGKEMSLLQLEASKHILACSFVDMDQDGIDEMILSTDYSEYDIIILSRKDDKVYSTVRKRDDLSCLSENGIYAKIRYIPEYKKDEWMGEIIAEHSFSYRRMSIDETGVHENELCLQISTVADQKQYWYIYENCEEISKEEEVFWVSNNLAPLIPFYTLNE